MQDAKFATDVLPDLRPTVERRSDDGPPDDQAEDTLVEMANLDEDDTGIGGTIFVSTALGSHGPRIRWYPGAPGRHLPCLIMSIEPEPRVRDDFLERGAGRSIVPRLTEWVALNHVALLEFWTNGDTWTRRQVAAFLVELRRVP